ncbi:enoyl-CoA hydratase/isomerase family protein [Mycolicibacterium confluentis]|uniref:Enoyl-CoA hydratase n=1 Tax=Mycolicibacterium confluentis TaxID=28047 RepID=A0A7I7Y591_9MYCO|nr:enoyl-CoA hydratase-related protein [Mycolicibacterium confluentis]MCV7318301.1 enoyl-CoA hydratase/isomerase family protein [Mycolicibacterium confluentis]ORV29619.1 enoyl-CoA hydratase [Mycolicibacterium confluentis]BBZ36212.1 enoyl-CoA hydratase [Mycolicibacterium confluentis]
MTQADTHRIETGTDTVLAQVVDGVGVVTLNRPHRRNALHTEIYEAVPRLLERFGADDGIGAVVITGAGGAFCAGGDVRDGGSARQVSSGDPEAEVAARSDLLTENARMVQLLHEIPKVTIAALPGAAVGAGMSIALAADLRIAARSAKLIPGWSKLAFSGDFGGAWFLTRLLGPSKALELLVADAPIDSVEGERLGLFNRVVSDDELPDAALRWAAEIAAGPTFAFAGVKANIADAQQLPLDVALRRESERMVRSALTEEHRQAVKRWLAAASKSGAPR